MPTVPTYGPPKVNAAPMPGVRRQAHETVESSGGPMGEALQGLGTQAFRIGAAGLDEIFKAQQLRQDNLAITTADRQLDDLETQLLHAPDAAAPDENGNVKGALKLTGLQTKDLPPKVLAKYDEQAGMIESTLENDRQRATFQRLRNQRRSGIFTTIQRHADQELVAYEKGEAEHGITQAVNTAQLNFQNTTRVHEELDRIKDLLQTHAPALDLKGPGAIESAFTKLRSQVHQGVIVAHLASPQGAPAARAYYEQHQDELLGGARVEMQKAVTSAGIEQEAFTASMEIFARHAPQDDDDPVNIDLMVADARTQYAKDPDTFKATVTYLHQMKQDLDAGRASRAASHKDTVWTAVFENTPLRAVEKLPDFINMRGEDKTAVRDYYNAEAARAEAKVYQAESRAYQAESRAYQRTQRARADEERDQFDAYYQLTEDPELFAQMRPGDIRARLPQLGRRLLAEALKEHDKLATGAAKVRAVTVDNDMFKEVAADHDMTYAHLPPGQQTPTERARLGKLREEVKHQIDLQQQAKGRELTYDEKRDLMDKALDAKVMLPGTGWFADDVAVPAVVIQGDDRTTARVPWAEMKQDPALVNAYVERLRKIYPNLQPDQIIGRYKSRMERAYAVTQMGGTAVEVEGILMGTLK